jgi:hypothetical protein
MECYPPSEKRLKLESLVARVVSPYLGHRGLYEGGNPKPVVPSRELDVAHLRRPSGKWKLILNDRVYQYVWLRTSEKASMCLWNSATPLNMSSKAQWDLFRTHFGTEDPDAPPIISGRHAKHKPASWLSRRENTMYEQDRHSTYNVTLRHVRVTVVAAEKQ